MQRVALSKEDHLFSGRLNLACNNYKIAIEAFSAAIKLDPTDAFVYCQRGHAYRGLYGESVGNRSYNGDRSHDLPDVMAHFDAATRDYATAIALDSDNADAYFGHGCMRYNELYTSDVGLSASEAASAGLLDLDKAIALNPQHGDAYAIRSGLHCMKENNAAAIADCLSSLWIGSTLTISRNDTLDFTFKKMSPQFIFNAIVRHPQAAELRVQALDESTYLGKYFLRNSSVFGTNWKKKFEKFDFTGENIALLDGAKAVGVADADAVASGDAGPSGEGVRKVRSFPFPVEFFARSIPVDAYPRPDVVEKDHPAGGVPKQK